MQNTIAQTLNALQNAKLDPTELAKATTTGVSQALGLVGYDLSAPAKTLYPVLTPLRNRIPRVSGNGDTATRWKAVTAINPSKVMMGVAEAARSGFIDQTVKEYVASYRGLGLENFLTFESELAAVGFDNARARASTALLQSVMIGEENVLLGGNTSLALGTTPTPTGVTRQASPASTSALAATLSIKCIALSHAGFYRSSVAGGVPVTIARDPGDGSATVNLPGGAAQISAAASIGSVGAAESVFASVTPVRGAVGYAWYYGAAGSELLGQITTTNSVIITAPAAGSQNATAHSVGAADRSTDSLVHDGLLTQIFDSAGGGYWQAMPTGLAANAVTNTSGSGTPLTADGSGGIKEIDAALLYFWENLRLTPDVMYVNAQELTNMTKALVKAGTNSAFRLVVNQGGEPGVGQLTLTAGSIIGSYLNKYTLGGGQTIPVILHPTMPPGMILFYSNGAPYPLSGIDNVLQVKTRRDYYQIDWPLRTRRYEFGIYTDQLLQNFFPPSFGLITGIANGLG